MDDRAICGLIRYNMRDRPKDDLLKYLKIIIKDDLADFEYKKDFCWACHKGLGCRKHNRRKTIKGAKLGNY